MKPDAAVWIDPGRRGGEPCIYGHRLSVEVVADTVYEDGVETAMSVWNLKRALVLGGCWYMARHARGSKWRKRWGEWAKQHDGAMWKGDYGAVPDPPTREP